MGEKFEIISETYLSLLVKPEVRDGILAMRQEIRKELPHLKYSWDPAYNGVDNYFLSRVAAQ